MKINTRFSVVLIVALLGSGAVFAQDSGEARAKEVLKSMSAYTASLDRLVIRGTAFIDGRLDAGLMVSNASEVKVTVDRPGSMHLSNFDGVTEKELFFDNGSLTLFSSDTGYYAQASVPNEIEAAAEYALEEMGIEAPLMDLIYRDVSAQMVGSEDTVMYLTDKARVGGVDCHHIAVRGPDVDLQLWIEEGDRPVPRKIMITSKWEGGAPRFFANMAWDANPQVDPEIFKFKVPAGAINIGFASQASSP